MSKSIDAAQVERLLARAEEAESDLDGLRLRLEGDPRAKSVLFNDITRAPLPSGLLVFSERRALAEHLWAQGWRRVVRPDDINVHPQTAADDAGVAR